MGTKSCTKILNFSTRFSCRRRFRNAPYGEKILLMGKSYNLMFGHDFGILVYALLCCAGEIQNSNCWKWQRIFS